MPRFARYGGQYVTENEMKEIKGQSVSEFLNFTKADNGRYLMQYKFPEKGKAVLQGQTNPTSFKIRENMNLLFKGIAEYYFDNDGNLNTDVLDGDLYTLSSQFTNLSNNEILDLLNIPVKKENDFLNFMNAFGKDIIVTLINQVMEANEMLQNYSNSLKGYELSQEKDPEVKKYLSESYPDFERQVADLKRLANMNVEKEMEVVGHMDCNAFGRINTKLAEIFDTNKPTIFTAEEDKMESKQVDMNDMPLTSPDGKARSFGEHFFFAAPVQLGGKKQYITMEMTAPPTGKVLFRGENGRSATGIVDTIDQAMQYHRENNYHENSSKIAFDGVKLGRINKQALSAEDKKFVKTSDDMRLIASKDAYDKKIEVLSQAVFPNKDYATLNNELGTSAVSSRLRGTSPEFEKMRTAFQNLGRNTDPSKRVELLNKLKEEAKKYLDYKEPKGDLKKEKDLNTYSKNRIRFARDVYQMASAEINQSKQINGSEKQHDDFVIIENKSESQSKKKYIPKSNMEELSDITIAAIASLEDQAIEGHQITINEVNRINVSALVINELVNMEKFSKDSPKLITQLIEKKGPVDVISEFSNNPKIKEVVDGLTNPGAVSTFLKEKRVSTLVNNMISEIKYPKKESTNEISNEVEMQKAQTEVIKLKGLGGPQ